MLFFDDPKRIATVMRSRRSGKGERTHDPVPMKPEVVKHEDGEIDGRHTAMQDFLAAHAESSPQKMAEAMANFMDMHAVQQAKPSAE